VVENGDAGIDGSDGRTAKRIVPSLKFAFENRSYGVTDDTQKSDIVPNSQRSLCYSEQNPIQLFLSCVPVESLRRKSLLGMVTQ